MILKQIFPDGITYGDGIVCAPSPFTATFVLDFYDGPTEGFARIASTNGLIYFQKLWWDERQNSRIFGGWIFGESDLKRVDGSLHDFVQLGFTTSKSNRQSAAAGDPMPANLIETVKSLLSAIRVHIFCTQITRELFILPVTD